jgi:hypothetical protein
VISVAARRVFDWLSPTGKSTARRLGSAGHAATLAAMTMRPRGGRWRGMLKRVRPTHRRDEGR